MFVSPQQNKAKQICNSGNHPCGGNSQYMTSKIPYRKQTLYCKKKKQMEF